MNGRKRFIIPGDVETLRGFDLPYKHADTILQAPSLPVRVKFLNALPASFIPMLVRGMAGGPVGGRSKYRGLAPSDSGFFPIIEKRKPWEREEP